MMRKKKNGDYGMKVVKQEQMKEWKKKKGEHLRREKLKKSRRIRGGGGGEPLRDEWTKRSKCT